MNDDLRKRLNRLISDFYFEMFIKHKLPAHLWIYDADGLMCRDSIANDDLTPFAKQIIENRVLEISSVQNVI